MTTDRGPGARIVARMSGILIKWVVLQHHDVTSGDLDTVGVVRDDVVMRWIETARDAYLDCCPVLREKAADTAVTIRCDLGAVPAGARFEGASSVSVSASATEFWPDAFTLAIRVRGFGADDDTTCDLTCRVSLDHPDSGESCELGDDVRDELIALAHAAQHYN
jgi:acyl-CoA thioesterase FadM